MYKAHAKLEQGFKTIATTSNDSNYSMDISASDGPMDLFTVAFSGCIAMCVKGYYFRTFNIENLIVEVDLKVDYENKTVVSKIFVDRTEKQLASDKEGILKNIKERCKISHLIDGNVALSFEFNTLNKK